MNAVFETRFAKIGETPEHYRTVRLNSTFAATEFGNTHLRPYFADKRDQEEMLVVCLDTQLHVIRIVRVTRGTLDASLVHPREIFRPAIADCASAVVLAHNHPSGDTTPSWQDIAITKRLKEAGDLLGIRILDHLIIGDLVVSLADNGHL